MEFSRFAKGLLKQAAGIAGKVAKASRTPLAPALLSSAANLIPSEDSKNRVLWYVRRFYMVDERQYGIEWRISRRLIQEVGSRLTGTLGVIFFRAPGVTDAEPESREGAVIGKLGLKPSYYKHKWLEFKWRPLDGASVGKEYQAETISANKKLLKVPLTIL